MNYRIAIPSYKRADIIKERTLNYLQMCNIDPSIIDIFVANEKEYETYKNQIPNELYGNMIIGEETLHKQRNFIRRYYNQNQYLLNIDDDVKCLKILKNKKLEETYELDRIIKFGFHILKKERTRLAGIYPANNHYFMNHSYHKGLYYCIGSCFWTINDNTPSLDVQLEDKEDFERSIKSYIRYKHLIRFDNITAQTDYYNTRGGMQETRTPSRVQMSGEFLINKYPHLCRKNKARKNHFEIQFIRQENNEKVNLNGSKQ